MKVAAGILIGLGLGVGLDHAFGVAVLLIGVALLWIWTTGEKAEAGLRTREQAFRERRRALRDDLSGR